MLESGCLGDLSLPALNATYVTSMQYQMTHIRVENINLRDWTSCSNACLSSENDLFLILNRSVVVQWTFPSNHTFSVFKSSVNACGIPILLIVSS